MIKDVLLNEFFSLFRILCLFSCLPKELIVSPEPITAIIQNSYGVVGHIYPNTLAEVSLIPTMLTVTKFWRESLDTCSSTVQVRNQRILML